MTIDSPNRHLLLGILALQMDFISREELVAATSVWLQDKSRPIEEILAGLGALSDGDRELLLPLVERHIKNHDGDADRSLAALSSIGSLADDLRTLGDQQVDATLSVVAGEGNQGSISAASPSRAAADPTAPRYRTLRPHAKGGLGEVSVAEDTELNREVALKVIQPQYAQDEGSRSRFVLEAEVTGGLEHPGIVPVYGLGHYDDGRPFYAMRFIRGDSLKEAADRFHHRTKGGDDGSEATVTTVRAPPSYDSVAFRRLLGRFVDVCNAVAYAHSRGVLHRDLKPGNIMLGKYGETLVVDWGLAKVKGRDVDTKVDSETTLNPKSGSGSAPTQMGRAMGTPSYMPPEQAAGNLDQIGPASDVYSLGATLYYLLVGQPPISSSSLEEILSKVRVGEFPPPRRIRHRVPRSLESICMKAMATSPAERYESPQSLADDVECFLADEPVKAHAEPLVSRLRRWIRKHPASVVALAMFALGLSGIALVQFRANRVLSSTNDQLEIAQQQTAAARDRAQRRGDLAVDAIDRFRTAVEENVDVKNRPELEGLRRTLLQAPKEFYESLTDELEQADESGQDTLERLAEAENKLAHLMRLIDSKDRAVATYQAAQGKYETLLGSAPDNDGFRRELAEIHNSIAGIFLEQRTLDEAEVEYNNALSLRRELIGRQPDGFNDHISTARMLVNLSMVEGARGHVKEALDYLTEAADLLEETLLKDSQNEDARHVLSRALERRGAVLSANQGRHDEGLVCLERSQELAEGLVEEYPDDPNHLAAQIYILGQLSFTYERMGNDSEAWSCAQKAHTLQKDVVEKNPTHTHFQFNLTETLARIATLQFERDEVAASLATMEDVLKLRHRLCDAHPGNVKYRESLGDTLIGIGARLYSLGRTEDALQKFRDLVPIQEEIVRLQPDDVFPLRALGGLHYNIGTLLGQLASEEEALDAFQESLRIRRRLAKRLPDDARFVNDLAYTLGNMSSIHEKNGGYDEALSLLDEAMQAQRGLVAKNSQTPGLIADLARTLSNRGNILAKAGRLGESQSVLSEAKDLLEPVVDADISTALSKRDLAGIYQNAGYTATYLNDVAAAHQSYRQAIDILSELHREQPNVLGNVLGLAKIQAAVGQLHLSQGQYKEARQAATDAIKLITDFPGDSETQNKSLGGVLRVAYRVRSVALARLNELTEAKADWDRMLSTAAYGDDSTVDRMIGPFYLPAWSGQADGAVAIAALAQQGIVFRTLHPELCYRFAETLALAAEQAETTQVAENHARNAVLWLERAEDAGFFQWNTKHMLHSQVFRTLDQRDDFNSLLERLANASQANSPGGRSSR